ncbi:hypothetical protein AB0H71_29225 [Nocardia sp. NPDC050697]|uniref:hypothetical protein n=1 Tax=Nocardia sp. NPDC050697 TaxID=3155158 RepID=UPI0033FF137F
MLAGLAAVGGLVAAWFEIRAVRAGRRTVTMDDGRWRVVARVAGDGALVFVGHDEEPEDSDDPEDAPSGWVWTFPAESIDAVRGVLAGACFPDDDPGELAELELLDLLGAAAGVLDPVARADPGAWLHGHGVRGERHEWGVDPTRTTRTLPIVGTPLAAPGRGAKRRRADASPGDGRGRVADARRAADRGSADGGARPGGQSSSQSARPGAGSASTSAEPKRRSARQRDASGPGGGPERSTRSAADREAEPEARARRGAAADRGRGQRRDESAARADSRRNNPAAARESRRRGHEAAARGESTTARRRGGEAPGRGAFTADHRRGHEAAGDGESTPDRRRGGEAAGHGGSTAERQRGKQATGRGESTADRGGESASRARGGATSERDAEAATDRTVSRRDRGARPDPTARRSADRPEPPGEYQAQDPQYSGPIRRRGVGRQQRTDPENWWETADGPTDRTYREPPPPRLSNPRRRRDD